jgi:hypothetical protein
VSEKHFVRLGSLGVICLSLALPAFMHVPAELPSIAMGSELLLYLERVLAVFGICLLLLVFLYRGLLRGELPRVISEKGVEWQEVAEGTARMTDTLQGEVGALREQVESIMLQLRPDTIDS